MNWQATSLDPNNPHVQQERLNELRSARASHLIDDREGYLVEQIKGLRVLDVGVVAHMTEAEAGEKWLHRRIRDNASYALGCDILEDSVVRLKELGYNVVCHDICQSPLNEKFDAIVLGEVIEHITEVGELLRNCAAMLSEKGRVYITTPNPWFITFLLKGLFSRDPIVESVDHVAWYDPMTICELGHRAGLKFVKYVGVRVTSTPSFKAKVLFGLFGSIGRVFLRRESLAKTVVYELAK